MSIPGYDLNDLDDKLAELLAERDPETVLTREELRRYDQGESLFDLLDSEDIEALLSRTDGMASGA